VNTVSELLDKVKEACSIPSDNALAEKLGVNRQLLWQVRRDEKPLSDERIAQLCSMAKLDAAEWVVRLHAERAQSPVERAMWSKMLVRLAAAAIFVAPLTAGAADKSLQNQAFAPEKSLGMYIMFKRVP